MSEQLIFQGNRNSKHARMELFSAKFEFFCYKLNKKLQTCLPSLCNSSNVEIQIEHPGPVELVFDGSIFASIHDAKRRSALRLRFEFGFDSITSVHGDLPDESFRLEKKNKNTL